MSDIVAILDRFWQLRRLMLVAVLIGVLAALGTIFRPSTEPPFLESRAFTRGVASTQVLIDSQRSALTNVAYDLEALSSRAQVFVQLVSTAEVRESIAREVGVSVDQLSVVPLVQRVAGVPSRNPSAGQRSDELRQELLGYRLEVRTAGDLPVLELTAQAPDAAAAARLANAGARATIAYLERLDEMGREERASGAAQRPDGPQSEAVRSSLSAAEAQILAFGKVGFRQLGTARGSLISTGGGIGGGVAIGIGAFFVAALLLYFLAGLRDELRRRRQAPAVARAAAAD